MAHLISSGRSSRALPLSSRRAHGHSDLLRRLAPGLPDATHSVQGFASPHPQRGVADTTRPCSYLWAGGAPRRHAGAGTSCWLRTPRAARGHICSMATRRECTGRNQHATRARRAAATPPRARRYSLRRARPHTSYCVSVETKAESFADPLAVGVGTTAATNTQWNRTIRYGPLPCSARS